jgi:phage gp36-like protein
VPYCTSGQIKDEISEDKLIQLTDDEGLGIVNEARVTAAIAKADGLIDSYCGQVEEVPFGGTGVPPVISEHSKTLAIYFLFGRRSAIPEMRRQNYEDAITHLKDISTGKAALPPITAAEITESTETQTNKTEDDRIFTRDKMNGY